MADNNPYKPGTAAYDWHEAGGYEKGPFPATPKPPTQVEPSAPSGPKFAEVSEEEMSNRRIKGLRDSRISVPEGTTSMTQEEFLALRAPHESRGFDPRRGASTLERGTEPTIVRGVTPSVRPSSGASTDFGPLYETGLPNLTEFRRTSRGTQTRGGVEAQLRAAISSSRASWSRFAPEVNPIQAGIPMDLVAPAAEAEGVSPSKMRISAPYPGKSVSPGYIGDPEKLSEGELTRRLSYRREHTGEFKEVFGVNPHASVNVPDEEGTSSLLIETDRALAAHRQKTGNVRAAMRPEVKTPKVTRLADPGSGSRSGAVKEIPDPTTLPRMDMLPPDAPGVFPKALDAKKPRKKSKRWYE